MLKRIMTTIALVVIFGTLIVPTTAESLSLMDFYDAYHQGLFAGGISAFDPQTESGYFVAPQNVDYAGIDGFNEFGLLRFHENELPRQALVCRFTLDDPLAKSGRAQVFIDYFTGSELFRFDRLMIDDVGTNGMPKKPHSINEDYFPAKTVLSLTSGNWFIALDGYSSFWAMHPELQYTRYEDMRLFYETVVPDDQRFPRKHPEPIDNPRSTVPRSRDGMPLDGMGKIVRLLASTKTGRDLVFFATCTTNNTSEQNRYAETLVYDELFTGEWLFTLTRSGKDKASLDKENYEFNTAFLGSIRPEEGLANSQSSYRTDKLPIDPYAAVLKEDGVIMPGNSWEDPDKAHMQSPSDIAIWDYHDFLLPYFKQAAFVGDYRRIYELYPRDNWIFPSATPSAQTPSSPLVDKKTHAVSTASQLHEAISKSKSGDTILVLCDIYTDQSIHVRNKKLTIMGYGDSTPTIVNDMHNLNGINNHLFYLDKATVTIKNLKLTSTNQMDCFYLKQSSLILGSGCEIFGMLDVAFLAGKSALTVDGASIYHNTGSICSDGASLKAVGQLTLTSGEIAYNNTDGVLIAVNTFTMSGGEIHHNISNALRILGLINPGMGKSEVSGGSISDNYSNAGVIMLNGGTLIISGGEITRNISSNYTGGINVSGFALSGRQYPAKVRMSSGRIYDNEVRHPMPASYWMATLGYNLNSHYEKAGNNLILHEMYAEQYVTDATLEMSGGQIYSRRGLSRNSSIIVSGTKSKATLSGKAEVETSSILVQNGGKLTDKRK